jgi:hypothetical protein
LLYLFDLKKMATGKPLHPHPKNPSPRLNIIFLSGYLIGRGEQQLIDPKLPSPESEPFKITVKDLLGEELGMREQINQFYAFALTDLSAQNHAV